MIGNPPLKLNGHIVIAKGSKINKKKKQVLAMSANVSDEDNNCFSGPHRKGKEGFRRQNETTVAAADWPSGLLDQHASERRGARRLWIGERD